MARNSDWANPKEYHTYALWDHMVLLATPPPPSPPPLGRLAPFPSSPQSFNTLKNCQKTFKTTKRSTKQTPDLLYFLGTYCTVCEILKKKIRWLSNPSGALKLKKTRPGKRLQRQPKVNPENM